MRLEGIADVLDFQPYDSRTEAGSTMAMGEGVRLADFRVFRYAKAGASNISKGKLQLAPAQKANHHNNAVQTAAAIGATSVAVTLGATALVADEYNEGYLAVNDATGEGQTYKIKRSPATDASGVCTYELFDPISVALTTSSEVSAVHNTFNAVVEAAVATRRAAGVPLISMAAGDFGFLQTKGVAAVLADQTTTLGGPLSASASVAGAVADIADEITTSAVRRVGYCDIMAGVDTEYRPITLAID